MPLPIILGGLAAIAGAVGIGSGIYGVSKTMEANDTLNAAKKKHEKAVILFKEKNSEITALMDSIGKQEIEILKSFSEFSDIIEKIQGRPVFKDINNSVLIVQNIDMQTLKDIAIGAESAVGLLSSVAAGVAGGFAAAGATTTIATAIGTASTGTAISSLSGVALSDAVLACLGGGSLAVGGGGVALGSAVLGGLSLGIGLLIAGPIFGLIGSNQCDSAKEAYEQAEKTEKEVNKILAYYTELTTVASSFQSALSYVEELYKKEIKRLDYVVNVLRKFHWSEFRDEEKLLTENTILLVELLYTMCSTGLVFKEKNDDGFNPVNKDGVESIIRKSYRIAGDIKDGKK